jgi:putative membrane protein
MRLLLRWILTAIALMVIARFVEGFDVRGFIPALIAAAVIGFINATLGTVVKILTFPLTIVTLGLFLIVINAVMLKFSAALVPGFAVRGWFAAIVGSILLSLISSLLHWLVGDKRRAREEYR